MQKQRVNVRTVVSHGLRLSTLSFASLLSVSAHADDPNPYFIGVREMLAHDSNVFRTNDPVSANYSTTSVLGGFDQRISRQRVYGNASVSLNRYSSGADSLGNDTDTLNNTSYGVNAGWDWQTIEKLSGSLTASVNRSLASLGNNSTTAQTAGNLVTTQQYGLSARWGGEGILTLEGDVSYNKVTYSDLASSNSTSNSGSLGGYYRVGPSLRLGAALRYSHTDAPEALGGANTENGRNFDLLANWLPTSTTSLYSRLSWTRQTNSQASSRDFSGLTGSINASYAATAKTSFTASFSRDAGVNGTFFTLNTNTPPVQGTPTPTPVSGLSESSQITNAFSFGATYAATSKISVTAGAQLRYAKLSDTIPSGTGTTTVNRNDNSKIYSLGVTYAIARSWQLGCNVSRTTRDLDDSVIAGGLSYTANVASCQAEFTLR